MNKILEDDLKKLAFHKLTDYFKVNQDRWIGNKELRSQKFVTNTKFSKWFDYNFCNFKNRLYNEGCKLNIKKEGKALLFKASNLSK